MPAWGGGALSRGERGGEPCPTFHRTRMSVTPTARRWRGRRAQDLQPRGSLGSDGLPAGRTAKVNGQASPLSRNSRPRSVSTARARPRPVPQRTAEQVHRRHPTTGTCSMSPDLTRWATASWPYRSPTEHPAVSARQIQHSGHSGSPSSGQRQSRGSSSRIGVRHSARPVTSPVPLTACRRPAGMSTHSSDHGTERTPSAPTVHRPDSECSQPAVTAGPRGP